MRGFEIKLNGRRVCVISSADELANWIDNKGLTVGDEVQIRVLETDHPAEPSERKPRKHPAGRQIAGIIGPY